MNEEDRIYAQELGFWKCIRCGTWLHKDQESPDQFSDENEQSMCECCADQIVESLYEGDGNFADNH